MQDDEKIRGDIQSGNVYERPGNQPQTHEQSHLHQYASMDALAEPGQPGLWPPPEKNS
jgi:hypothetical protein